MPETLTTKELARLFESVLEVTIYDAGCLGEITREQLKAISEKDRQFGGMEAALVQVKVPTREMKRILPIFRSLLREFVDKDTDRIGNGLVDLAGGMPTPKMLDYVRKLIRAAAVLGSIRTAELLIGWIQGEPVRYRSVNVLNGINIDQPLKLQEGLHIYRLPTSEYELAAHLPTVSLDVQEPHPLLGCVVLSIEYEAVPALYLPSNVKTALKNSNPIWARGQIENISIDSFCEAMSLACGGCVRWKFSWKEFGEVREFLNAISEATLTDVPFFTGATNFSQENFEHAREIYDLRNATRENNPSLDTTIRRWIKSKSRHSLFADQLIDLRIALEALYLDRTEGELRFRLASYGAWHVSQNFEERKRNFQTLMNAYALASNAVHGGNVKKNDKNNKLLENAQRLCREGILKRLEEERKPEWNDLIMGEKQ